MPVHPSASGLAAEVETKPGTDAAKSPVGPGMAERATRLGAVAAVGGLHLEARGSEFGLGSPCAAWARVLESAGGAEESVVLSAAPRHGAAITQCEALPGTPSVPAGSMSAASTQVPAVMADAGSTELSGDAGPSQGGPSRLARQGPHRCVGSKGGRRDSVAGVVLTGTYAVVALLPPRVQWRRSTLTARRVTL